MEKRNYLLLLKLSMRQPEHINLIAALRKIDSGAYFAHLEKLSGFALIQTHLDAVQIDEHLIGVLLNDDQRLIVEVGSDYHAYRLGAAAGWLHTHFL